MSEVIARARGLIGCPFRLHGRSPEVGLDCVGLILRAFELDCMTWPRRYALRGHRMADLLEFARDDFRRVPSSQLREGDVLILDVGRDRLHVGLWSGTGVIHADAVVDRVCERPGKPQDAIKAVLRRRQQARKA